MLFYFLLLIAYCNCCTAQRNPEAEGMCQPFLTSNFSSPLLPDIRRNLKIDEDGEYYCELVLQDRELPDQVRVTIHEGLSFLAIRHVQMGLERHRDVLRHLKILAQLIPSSFNFQFRAGLWSLDDMVAQPEEAVGFLRAALYGSASKDTTVDENDKMEARKYFAEALGYIGEFEEAQKELLIILKRYPLDFGVVFLLKETMHQLQAMRVETPAEVAEEIRVALSPAEQLYASITAQADVQYTGFRISPGWAPQEFSGHMPAPADFEAFVAGREPFLVRTSSSSSSSSSSGGGGGGLNSLLNWTVDGWSNMDYLRDTVGPDESVLVEKMTAKAAAAGSTFGFSGGVHKSKMTFASFLERNFGENANSDGTRDLLNVPGGYFHDGIWNNPLNKLQADIPVPHCLASRAENITSVNMWMSNAPGGSSLTSRLHMDPLDSLYVVVGGTGRTTFLLHSPDQASSASSSGSAAAVRTISPTYGVSPEGFSFQYNSPAGLPSLDTLSPMQAQGHEVGKGHYHFSSRLPSESESGAEAESSGLRSRGGSVVELKAGDVIFIPAGWYYEVTTSNGPSVAVNFWWLPAQWRSTLALETQMKAVLVDQLKQQQGQQGQEGHQEGKQRDTEL